MFLFIFISINIVFCLYLHAYSSVFFNVFFLFSKLVYYFVGLEKKLWQEYEFGKVNFVIV
jgi:hypothetical protein